MSVQTIRIPHGEINFVVTEHCDNITQLSVWTDGGETTADCTGLTEDDIDDLVIELGEQLLGVQTEGEAYSDLGVSVKYSYVAFTVFAHGVEIYTRLLEDNESLEAPGIAFIEAMVYYGMPIFFFFDGKEETMITVAPDNLAMPDNGQIVVIEWRLPEKPEADWSVKWTPTKRRAVVRMHLRDCEGKSHAFFSELLDEGD